MRLVLRVLVNALALGFATWLLDDIFLSGGSDTEKALTLLVVAAVFAVVDTFVAPVAKFLSIPFIILTLGLFLFVVNGLMLLLTSWIADQIGLGWHVEGFWTAVLGAIVVTVATWVLEIVIPDAKRR